MSNPFLSAHHHRVGGIPGTMGPWQVELLRKAGLQPHHRVLDLGCGTLRGGLRLIDYLAAGCYVGVDPLAELVSIGGELAVEAGLTDKAPALATLDLLDSLPPYSFDYVLTQSVLNHLNAIQIRLTVRRVARMLKNGGTWVTTGCFSDDVDEVDIGAPHPSRPNERLGSIAGLPWFRGLLADEGLTMTPVLDHPHPRDQSVFVVRRDTAVLQRRLESILGVLCQYDTSPEGADSRSATDWLKARLERCGFDVEVTEGAQPPTLVARRRALGDGSGHIVMYNHYDVDTARSAWTTPPFQMTCHRGRWSSLGIGDNKGALACRLLALEDAPHSPAITWLIQGQEESGSAVLRALLKRQPLPKADLYLDENGWTDPTGGQRVLCYRSSGGIAASPVNDAEASAILAMLGGEFGRYIEARPLNKYLVDGGCPFQAGIPPDGLYLGIGTNDALTRIHQHDETISIDRALEHIRQIRCVLTHFARHSR